MIYFITSSLAFWSYMFSHRNHILSPNWVEMTLSLQVLVAYIYGDHTCSFTISPFALALTVLGHQQAEWWQCSMSETYSGHRFIDRWCWCQSDDIIQNVTSRVTIIIACQHTGCQLDFSQLNQISLIVFPQGWLRWWPQSYGIQISLLSW